VAHALMIRSVIAANKNSYKPLCKHVNLNTEKTGPLVLAWHHLNSDFQAFWNLAKYLVFLAAGALGDSIRFGISIIIH
jgi:hypothetical protein